MEAAAGLRAITVDSPLEEVISVLSAASAAAQAGTESDCDALTAALLSLPPSLPPAGAGQQLCQLTAELGKREGCRARLSAPEPVGRLVLALQAAASDQQGSAALVEPCRALGNLCYDGVPARTALLEPPGPAALTAAVGRAAAAADKDGVRAREVASGLVLNFINDHPAGIDWAVESGSLSRLITAGCDDVSQSSLLRHTLVAAAVVAESARREALLATRLAPLLAACLLPQRDPSVLEEALDTAAAWCRHDEAKLTLAQGGVADSLVCLLPAADCPAEARSLLVELLSGDQAMAAVYRRGEGAVYLAVRRWLAEAAGEQLTVCACHALGNFATNDDHALAMVRAGVHDDLVAPLTSDSVQLQMAALGLLRNLCLPSANKATLLEAGLLDHLLSLSVAEQPALFKYYGTLRLLAADSAAASGRLANHPRFLAQLTEASCGDGPYGVQHEACRLLARIVRTAQCTEVSQAVVSAGGHSSLVRLLQADNAVMTNEAIMALCYTTPHTNAQQIASSELAAAMTSVMSSAALPVQVKENAATLLVLLRSREEPEVAEALSAVPQAPAPAMDP